MTSPSGPRRGGRAAGVGYAEASRNLLREMVLDAMRGLLLVKDWSGITLSDVAGAAGVNCPAEHLQRVRVPSGPRAGVCAAARRPAGRRGRRGHQHEHRRADVAFLAGFRAFFAASAADPLVISLLTGVAKPDLLQIITIDSAPIITRCSARLADVLSGGWIAIEADDAGVLARAIVRLAMSYVSMPPEADHDVAADLARLLGPFVDRYGAGRSV